MSVKKKITSLSLFAICLVLCLLPDSAISGAWTRKKGDWQLISTIFLYKASDYFDLSGKRRAQPSYYKQAASAYAEYGLRDDLTIGGELSVLRVHQTSGNREISRINLGDSELFIRKNLWKNDNMILSLQPYLIIPSPDKKNQFPKTGSDNFSFGIKINYGISGKIANYGYYLDAATGLLHRAGMPHDQWKSELSFGINLDDKWQIIPQAFITRNRGKIMNSHFTQAANDDYNANAIQLSAKYSLNKDAALQAGIYKTISGKNTGAGNGALFSFIKNF